MLQTTVSGGGVPVTTNENEIPMFVDTKRFSEMSGLSVDVICNLCRNGKLAHIRVGRRIMINRSVALQQLNESSMQSMKIADVSNQTPVQPYVRRKTKAVCAVDSVDSAVQRLRRLAVGK